MTAMETQLQTVSEGTFLEVIRRAAADPNVDIVKMQALLDMQERIHNKQAEISFNQSMRQAQDEMGPVYRDAENSHTRSRYARLETIDEKIRPVYTRHGFALSFNSEPAGNGNARVICEVSHEAGFSKKYTLEGGLDTTGAKGTSNKTDIQGMGSTVSYLRRYLTLMIFNLVMSNEDNDGNGGYIDEYQAKAISGLIAASKADQVKFLRDFMRVESIETIRARDYRRAVTALTEKLRKNGHRS